MVVMIVMMMVMIMVVMMVMMMIIIISHDNLFGHPQIYCWIILGHGVLYFCLFSNFYSKSYMSKAKDSKSQLAKEKTGEKLEKQITNGKIPKQLKEDEDKDGKEEKEEDEEEGEGWEVLKS